MTKISKRMRKINDGLVKTSPVSLEEGVRLLKDRAIAKFDETIDIAMKLNVDVRKSEQNVRGVISLPYGTGKKVRVAVFAKGDKAEEAKSAGADIVGSDDLLKDIQDGKIAFDRCITTPDMMATVGRVAKILGPKGLMPNPKLGTVTTDVKKAVTDSKAGQLEYRAEKNGIVHARVGKSSFDPSKIASNVKFFVTTLLKNKPSTVKGEYLKKIFISSSMGISIELDNSCFY